MTAWVGVVLALSLGAGGTGGHNGTNGLDPSAIALIWDAGGLRIDKGASARLERWLAQGTAADRKLRLNALKYFIACAFDDTVDVRYDRYRWRGAYGLAPQSTRSVIAAPGKRGAPERLRLLPAEGKWVSACLMAHANTLGRHQYVSLRGNPEAWAGTSPSPGTRWTMSYPEGVFFANLLQFNYDDQGNPAEHVLTFPGKAVLERSFTQSLNVPVSCPTPQTWKPPNVTLGRTLDWEPITRCKTPEIGVYRCARKLGAFTSATPAPSAVASDPDYSGSAICVNPVPRPAVVPCPGHPSKTVLALAPLFVHLPRLVHFRDLANAADPGEPMQVIGAVESLRAQIRPCVAPGECVGPFRPASVREPVKCAQDLAIASGSTAGTPAGATSGPGRMSEPAVLAGLGKGQAVTVVLRHVASREPADLKVDPKEKFTAIVRYRSPVGGLAAVDVLTDEGQWREAGGTWVPSQDGTFQWAQIYPVQPSREGPDGILTLSIRIRGRGPGQATDDALELDVAGFVPGAPWCAGREPREAPELVVCPDSDSPGAAVARR